MYIISPGHHPEADKFWKEKLSCKPNGARTLGAAITKNLSKTFEPYYDMLITYASNFPFEIPEDVKKIAVIHHENFPWVDGFRAWQKVNNKLKDYEVDYFVNEQKILGLIKDVYPRVFYLPRFVDTEELPKVETVKDIDTLWFGNAWGAFQTEFGSYKGLMKKPYWITHGEFGLGEEKIKDIDREETLKTVARAKTVWAIGVSQLEAQYYGCKIFSYRGPVLPFYNQKTIRQYLSKLLREINSK